MAYTYNTSIALHSGQVCVCVCMCVCVRVCVCVCVCGMCVVCVCVCGACVYVPIANRSRPMYPVDMPNGGGGGCVHVFTCMRVHLCLRVCRRGVMQCEQVHNARMSHPPRDTPTAMIGAEGIWL